MKKYRIEMDEVVAERVVVYVEANSKEEAEAQADAAAAESTADREFLEVERRTVLSVNEMPKPKPRIGIRIEGGIVQSAFTQDPNLPEMELVVVDCDTDGAGESELTAIPQGDGTSCPAVVSVQRIDRLEDREFDLDSQG